MLLKTASSSADCEMSSRSLKLLPMLGEPSLPRPRERGLRLASWARCRGLRASGGDCGPPRPPSDEKCRLMEDADEAVVLVADGSVSLCGLALAALGRCVDVCGR